MAAVVPDNVTNTSGGAEEVQAVITVDPDGNYVAGGGAGGGAVTLPTVTPFKSLDLDETEEEVKATAGAVYFIHAMNMAATKRYLKFYNATAANVTVGTTVPVLTFPLPTLGDTNGQGFCLSIPGGITFATAICAAATTGFADNDTGAPAANDVILNLGYA